MQNTLKKPKEKERWKLSANDIQNILFLFYEREWAKNRIARKYKVDHTTIIYHVRKHAKANGIMLKTKHVDECEDVHIEMPDDTDFDGDKITKGFSYDEYVSKDRIIQMNKQAECAHSMLVICTYKCRGCGKMHSEEISSEDIAGKLKLNNCV